MGLASVDYFTYGRPRELQADREILGLYFQRHENTVIDRINQLDVLEFHDSQLITPFFQFPQRYP